MDLPPQRPSLLREAARTPVHLASVSLLRVPKLTGIYSYLSLLSLLSPCSARGPDCSCRAAQSFDNARVVGTKCPVDPIGNGPGTAPRACIFVDICKRPRQFVAPQHGQSHPRAHDQRLSL